MFARLKLTNFKAWQDTGDIDLKPVTMLLGTNSSGKSSLIQSLLLLKQTVQSPDRSIHLNLGGDEMSDLFNFGSFDNVLRQGASDPRQFSVSFSLYPSCQSLANMFFQTGIKITKSIFIVSTAKTRQGASLFRTGW
jgi:AAA15 family ATPase/GTPase